MAVAEEQFEVRLAESAADLRAAQRLRYEVFVAELGGDGPLVDHDARLEQDRFDPYCDHLILTDKTQGDAAMGVYRVLRDDQAARAGQFYSEDEYDLSVLKSSGRRLMELGRSCLAPACRGGSAMYTMWNGLARYVAENRIDILFGVASFHGTDPQALSQPLSLLHHRHLAPERLQVASFGADYQTTHLLPEDDRDRRAAMLKIPALIKAYLRLGGYVGDGAYVDHAFNTTDICLVMDTERLNSRQKSIYSKGITA